jgi:ketosteroid isomerase-like protein
MSRKNVETLRRCSSGGGRGSPRCRPTSSRPRSSSPPFADLRGGPYRGYDGARDWLRDIHEQFETWAYTIGEWHDLGTRVLALGSVQLEGRGSGLALDQEVGWLAGFSADGRVTHIRVFADHEAAREAAATAE